MAGSWDIGMSNLAKESYPQEGHSRGAYNEELATSSRTFSVQSTAVRVGSIHRTIPVWG